MKKAISQKAANDITILINSLMCYGERVHNNIERKGTSEKTREYMKWFNDSARILDSRYGIQVNMYQNYDTKQPY